MYWHQPEIFDAIVEQEDSEAFSVDIDKSRPTPGAEALGLTARWPGNYSIQSIWRDLGDDNKIYAAPGWGQSLQIGVQLPPNWKDQAQGEIEDFLAELMPDMARGPGSDMETAAWDLAQDLRLHEASGKTWLASENTISASPDWNSLYDQRSSGPSPLIAGAWRFSVGTLTTQVSLTEATIWGDVGLVVADVGGDVAGPIVDGTPASMKTAKEETRRVFAVFGLPTPTFEDVRWDNAHTCSNSPPK